MWKREISTFLLPLVLLGSLVQLWGCSAFQSHREMDMTPFAENTAAMFAEARKVSRPFVWNYLKPHVGTLPELLELRKLAGPALKGLGGIVMYSNQIVALNMSAKTDKETNRELAKYLQEAADRVTDKSKLEAIGINPASLDTVLVNIGKQETYLDGLAAAAPLVNAFVLAMLQRLDEIGNVVPDVEAAIDREIENTFREKRQNFDSMVRLQVKLLREVTLLNNGRYGDQASLDTLLKEDATLKEFIKAPSPVTPREFESAEKALAERLGRVDTFLRQMDWEKQVYLAKRAELTEYRAQLDEKIGVARDAVMVWGQSHRNLAAGIAVPPLIDVGGVAGGLAKKVVPLP